MSQTLVVVRANIRVRRVYECAKCHRRKAGGAMFVELQGYMHPSDVMRQIASTRVSNNYMPVGWASFWGPHGDVFKCPDHSET